MVNRLVQSLLLLLLWLPLAATAQQHKHQPTLATGAAFAPDGSVVVVGVDAGALFIQRRQVNGEWGERKQLAIGEDTVATTGDNRPKIAFGLKDEVVISYTHPLAKPYTGEIRMLRSEDGGQNFSRPFTVHQDRQIITHRFDAIQFDARGDLYTFWIDKRDAEQARQRAKDGPSGYDGAAIYYNITSAGGRVVTEDRKLADYSCECCRISLIAQPQEGVAALWRHVFPGSVRDHAFARVSRTQVSTPVRASHDDWVIRACPHHGPALARAADGGYHAVWFGDRQGQQRVRYGRLDAEGHALGDVRALPDARAEHPDMVSSGQRVVIAWRSFDGLNTQISVWISEDDGRHFTLRRLQSSSLENDYPRLIEREGKIALVWRTEREIHVTHF
jgi:hypothetical protein